MWAPQNLHFQLWGLRADRGGIWDLHGFGSLHPLECVFSTAALSSYSWAQKTIVPKPTDPPGAGLPVLVASRGRGSMRASRLSAFPPGSDFDLVAGLEAGWLRHRSGGGWGGHREHTLRTIIMSYEIQPRLKINSGRQRVRISIPSATPVEGPNRDLLGASKLSPGLVFRFPTVPLGKLRQRTFHQVVCLG